MIAGTPAVTPRDAASPRDANLFMAPRILKLPVRCRFSAFRTTLPPVRCDKLYDPVTGVCCTTDWPAARAASMSFRVIVGRSLFPMLGLPYRCARSRDRQRRRRRPRDRGERFRHHGFGFTDCFRDIHTEWPDLPGHDLVLLLGSEWSVYWDDVARSVRAECELVKNAVEQGFPSSPSVLGAQITARALADGERARRPEVGWHHVESDRPEVIATGPWLQWHFDVLSVPAGLTEIARSPSGPQAMVGGRVLGTQFHPEATETMLSRWTSGDSSDLRRLGLDPDEVMAATRREVVNSRPRAEALVDWFVDEHMGHQPRRDGRQ